MKSKDRQMMGPIPGENFTSDTRNQPWHRPPEITNIDKAVSVAIEKILDEDSSSDFIDIIEAGATIAEVTDMLVTSGIGKGKWTPDTAILIAGPVAKSLEIAAKVNDVEYKMGTDKPKKPTSLFIKSLVSSDKQPLEQVQQSVEEPEQPPIPQTGMLG